MIKSNLTETTDDRVEKVQLLLENPEKSKLLNLARTISPNNQFTRDLTAMGVKIKKAELKATYNVAYKLDEIHSECQRYNLAFIKGSRYEGEFTTELLQKLQTFLDVKKIAVVADDLTTCLYFLAPAEPDMEEKAMKYPTKDPLMFWKMPDDYYVLIDGSKNYVTPLNWYRGLKNNTVKGCRLTYTLEIFALLCAICYTSSWYWQLGVSPYWMVGLMLMSIVLHSFRMLARNSKESGDHAFQHYHSHFNQQKYPVCKQQYTY